MRTGIHSANLATSKRLQRVLKALKGSGKRGLSTWQIIAQARVCAVSAIISELRQGGVNIICKREADIFTYRIQGAE